MGNQNIPKIKFKEEKKTILENPIKYLKKEKTIITPKKDDNLKEIKEFADILMNKDFLFRKEYCEKHLKEIENNINLNLKEKYIEILKLLFCNNINKKILNLYLNFIKLNDISSINKSLSFEKEIEYYKCCFNKNELKEYFQHEKKYCEKENFEKFLEYIYKYDIIDKNQEPDNEKLKKLYLEIGEIKKHLFKFNQPIIFNENDELYYYKNYYLFIYNIYPNNYNKITFYSIISLKKQFLEYTFQIKLFDFLNSEEKYNYFMISLLKSETISYFQKNINRIKEYKKEEYLEIIKKNKKIIQKDDNLVLIGDYYFDNPKELCYENIISEKVNLKEKFSYFNFNYMKNHSDYEEYKKQIKNFLKKILNTKLFKEINDIFYDKQKNIFKEKSFDEIINNKIFFYPLNIFSSGETDKF